MKLILRSLAAFVVTIMSFSSLLAQEIAYRIDWGAPNSHLFDIEMRFQNAGSGPVSVRIPAWRPGVYVIQNYTKNIVRFSATDAEGAPLGFTKTDKGTWEINAAPGQEVVVRYQVYSRQLDAGASYLGPSEAYINPITMLMYVPGWESAPVTLAVKRPEGWRAATQLVFDAGRNTYSAPNYHALVDAPIVVSPTLEMLSFEFAGATFEVAIQGDAEIDRQKLLNDLQRIAEVQVDIMGVIPFDRYVFLYHFLDWKSGHGVEHSNSTEIMLGPSTSDEFYPRVLSVSAHELFHAWLVERIRPEAIYEPDYSSEQYTTTMWIYEGITAYYTSVTLVRSGLITEDAFLKRLAGSIKTFELSYGKNITSVAMSSWDSWAKQSQAPPDTYYSFYTAGEVLGMLLDMEVRGRTRNRQSLDNVFQFLYQQYAARDQGVPEDGLERAIETITAGTIRPFFDAYVYGMEPIDYDRYLYHAGYRLSREIDADRPPVFFGVQPSDAADQYVIQHVYPESPAYLAGLDIDDILLAINGRKVTTANLTDLLKEFSPGQTISVTIFRGDLMQTVDVVLQPARKTKFELVRLPNPTLLQNQTRRDWMNLAAG